MDTIIKEWEEREAQRQKKLDEILQKQDKEAREKLKELEKIYIEKSEWHDLNSSLGYSLEDDGSVFVYCITDEGLKIYRYEYIKNKWNCTISDFNIDTEDYILIIRLSYRLEKLLKDKGFIQ